MPVDTRGTIRRTTIHSLPLEIISSILHFALSHRPALPTDSALSTFQRRERTYLVLVCKSWNRLLGPCQAFAILSLKVMIKFEEALRAGVVRGENVKLLRLKLPKKEEVIGEILDLATTVLSHLHHVQTFELDYRPIGGITHRGSPLYQNLKRFLLKVKWNVLGSVKHLAFNSFTTLLVCIQFEHFTQLDELVYDDRFEVFGLRTDPVNWIPIRRFISTVPHQHITRRGIRSKAAISSPTDVLHLEQLLSASVDTLEVLEIHDFCANDFTCASSFPEFDRVLGKFAPRLTKLVIDTSHEQQSRAYLGTPASSPLLDKSFALLSRVTDLEINTFLFTSPLFIKDCHNLQRLAIGCYGYATEEDPTNGDYGSLCALGWRELVKVLAEKSKPVLVEVQVFETCRKRLYESLQEVVVTEEMRKKLNIWIVYKSWSNGRNLKTCLDIERENVFA